MLASNTKSKCKSGTCPMAIFKVPLTELAKTLFGGFLILAHFGFYVPNTKQGD